VAVKAFRYAATAWGVGEVWLDGARVVWHELPRAGSIPDGRATHPLVERLRDYFAGDPGDFHDVEIDLEEYSPFHRDLADALRSVGRGQVITYGELAALAGRPGAQRAAGTFCAQNRMPIIVPCHRVVSATGLGSYGQLGVAYKRRLLELEGWSEADVSV
jgi:methylated-DNA-[protein]-cysteine S-methyltransferase